MRSFTRTDHTSVRHGITNAWRGSKPDEGSLSKTRTEPSTDYEHYKYHTGMRTFKRILADLARGAGYALRLN